MLQMVLVLFFIIFSPFVSAKGSLPTPVGAPCWVSVDNILLNGRNVVSIGFKQTGGRRFPDGSMTEFWEVKILPGELKREFSSKESAQKWANSLRVAIDESCKK